MNKAVSLVEGLQNVGWTVNEDLDLKLGSPKFNRKMTVSVDIKNTGGTPGKEAVQLCVS